MAVEVSDALREAVLVAEGVRDSVAAAEVEGEALGVAPMEGATEALGSAGASDTERNSVLPQACATAEATPLAVL